MKDYRYVLVITAESKEEADKVLAERIGHDEEVDGVGDYTIDAHEEKERDGPEDSTWALLNAYALGAVDEGVEIDWENLDDAFARAKAERPGVYERLVAQYQDGTGEADDDE